MSTIYDIDAGTINAFTAAYIASLDPSLQALWNKRIQNNPSVDYGTMYKAFMAVAEAGLVLVNLEVDAMGTTPLTWMLSKENAGYHSFWNALQPDGSVGNYGGPPSSAPPGALLVSSNIADWKPFPTTPPPVPVVSPSVVGNFMNFQLPGLDGKMHDVYSSAAQQHYPEGYSVVGPDGATYLYHMLGTPMMSTSQRTGVWLKQ